MWKARLIFIISFFFFQSVHLATAAEYLVDREPTPVDYTLPYPGLLPTDPLYFLKVTRDNIFGFFLSDPLKKAEFFLLQADKRIEASYLLLTQEKQTGKVVLETFEEGETYLSQAILSAAFAKQQGITIDEFQQRLLLSVLKYHERAQEMQPYFESENVARFEAIRKSLIQSEKKIRSLAPQEDL